MKVDIISWHDLKVNSNSKVQQLLEAALLQKGIVGIKDVPDFEKLSQQYVNAAREFSALPENVKDKYKPNRDAGHTNGYELGAEKFMNKKGEWQIDNKKASYYASVPDNSSDQWPVEVDLRSSYQALGQLIFHTGKIILDCIGLNSQTGLSLDEVTGYGRMLHYHQVNDNDDHPDWCGSHFDHGIFTGLMPAYYFRAGKAIAEPEEAGLFIQPSNNTNYEKFDAADKSILLFQVGEFGQLISNDRIKATQHRVQKAYGQIERFAFALFYSASKLTRINPRSALTKDVRYQDNKNPDGSLTYDQWETASYARYRA